MATPTTAVTMTWLIRSVPLRLYMFPPTASSGRLLGLSSRAATRRPTVAPAARCGPTVARPCVIDGRRSALPSTLPAKRAICQRAIWMQHKSLVKWTICREHRRKLQFPKDHHYLRYCAMPLKTAESSFHSRWRQSGFFGAKTGLGGRLGAQTRDRAFGRPWDTTGHHLSASGAG